MDLANLNKVTAQSGLEVTVLALADSPVAKDLTLSVKLHGLFIFVWNPSISSRGKDSELQVSTGEKNATDTQNERP